MPRSRLVPLTIALMLIAAAGLVPRSSGARFQQAASGSPLMGGLLEDNELPVAPSFVRLLRITLEPGAKSPLHTHPGPEFNLIESGTLRVLVQGKALLTRAPREGTPAPVTETPPDGEFVMRRGDAIVYTPGTALTFRNSGSRPAVMLAVVILPAGNQRPPGLVWVGQAPSEEDLQGVSSDVLGDGVATSLPAGQAEVLVERLLLGPGDPIPAYNGPVMISVDDGTLDFEVRAGDVQVSRTADPGPRAEAEIGTAFSLGKGDAAFFPIGMAEAPRSDRDGELQLLRLTIAPTGPSAVATPAPSDLGVIEIAAPPEATPEPTDEPEDQPAEEPTRAPDDEDEPTPAPTEEAEPTPEGIGEGATVVVIESGVNLRSAPSTDADVVGALEQGQVLVVTGPSEEGSGYVWWPVQDAADPSISGYVAEDFIELQQGE